MTAIQWLLINGPAHGRVAHIKAGSQVRWPGADGEEYLYVGRNFLHNGDLYRVGMCHSEGKEPGDLEIARLIEQAALAPLPDRVG